jgi:hypothetical protein
MTVPRELEDRLCDTHWARKKCMTALPDHAKQFWRNSSRGPYIALLHRVLEQSTIAPLAHYIEQYY